MAFVLLFFLCSLALALGLPQLCGFSPWWGILLFPGAFLLLHLLFCLFFWLFTLGLDRSKPLEKQRPMCRTGARLIARILCVYSGLRPHLSGLEKLPEEPFLLVCNHRSLFDPMMMIAYLAAYNISFVSKPSNLKLPLFGSIAYGAGYLPIDRENDRKALKTILTAADYLKRGVCSMGIFPEGTRSRSGRLLPFHAGSFKIAQKAGAPLAIAAVRGTEQVKKRLPFRTTDVYLDILEVLPAQQVKAMSTHELSEYSRTLIREKTGQKEETEHV